jgi:amino acid transporter
MAMAAPAEPGKGFSLFKRLMLGRSMTSGRMEHTLLPKSLAIPVLSADCLSSVAYTVEATLLVLVGVSLAARHLLMPITIAVALLMSIVVTSYMQTVRAYRTSGGAYVVAKENLGTTYGLVAAGSLMVGYVLTVAVSIVAGVIAITSAVPALLPYKVPLSMFFVAFITLANLRGVRESGILFAIPTYGFIVAIFVMVAVGLWRCTAGCPTATVPNPVAAGEEIELGILVILEAFAVGSSALTGVEAISNAVTVFRRPQGRHAAETLLILGSIAVTLILTMAFLANRMNVVPSRSASVVSIIARTTFAGSDPTKSSPMFLVVQIFTFAILVLAANTSFQGFPRLAALMARDGYLPRQFENVGDRLVYSNGMIVLAVLSAALIWAFDANVELLIPLYAVGVFTAFTLSQSGMVMHWRTLARRGGADRVGWRRSLIVNASGAVVTASVVVIITLTRFRSGVWVVIAAMPFFVLLFQGIRRHYDSVGRQLHEGSVEVVAPSAPRGSSIVMGGRRVSLTGREGATGRTLDVRRNTVVLVVDQLDAATAQAIGYLRSFAGRDFRAVHAPVGRNGDASDLVARWSGFSRSDRPIEMLRPGRGPDAVIDYIRGLPRPDGSFVTVVIPELFREPSLYTAVRHRTAFSLKLRLLGERQVVVIDVPLVEADPAAEPSSRALIPRSSESLVFVSSASDASVLAINYALTLHAHDTRAVYVAVDAEGPKRIQEAWADRRIPVQLDIIEAPFRDLGPPILEEVRHVTSRSGAIATVVIPEFVVNRWWQHALHNQRALFMKRLLLFEPRVVVSSVPFQIR